jgi:hypothetical protein
MTEAVAPKKATGRKSTIRKTTARKATGSKPRAVHPMTPTIRDLGASVLAAASEEAMSSQKLGVVNVVTKELPGQRQGMATVVKLEDGTRIQFTMVVR